MDAGHGEERIYTVRLEPGGHRFDAPAGRTVLQAAADAGIELASSCRNGSCRTCMVRVLQGEVAYTIEWPGLIPEEKQAGWMLPCVAQPRSDLVVALQAHAPAGDQ